MRSRVGCRLMNGFRPTDLCKGQSRGNGTALINNQCEQGWHWDRSLVSGVPLPSHLFWSCPSAMALSHFLGQQLSWKFFRKWVNEFILSKVSRTYDFLQDNLWFRGMLSMRHSPLKGRYLFLYGVCKGASKDIICLCLDCSSLDLSYCGLVSCISQF